MKTKIITAKFLLFFLFFTSAYAQDWPQYLGPERNSKSPQENILRSWPEEGPVVLWTVPVGIGYGGPAVKDGKVYLLDREKEKSDIMRCFDLNSGEELWKFEYEAPGSVRFPGSRSVPTVEENRLYSCGVYGDLYCFDTETHEPVWHNNVWTDFDGAEFPIWAISQCPLIYNDLLIVSYITSKAPEAGVVAYNKYNGEVVWRTPPLGQETYVSPSIVKIDGADHVVMVTSSTNPVSRADKEMVMGNVTGMDPMTGEIFWNYDNWHCHISVPPAVDAGNNKVLVTGGYELGAVMLKIEKQDDGSYQAKELFRTEEFGDQTKPPLLIDGYFYAQFGTNRTRDGLTCMSMEGEIMWKTKREPDFNKGSMILADGLIIATDGSKGLYLIEPDPQEYKPIESSEILVTDSSDGKRRRMSSQNWAPIALADGKLLIRDQSRMYCLKIAE